jgi:pimeloyl-ACP methyl ester carboxylesterase
MDRPVKTPVVNLRRAYFECPHGQLHVRTAFPSTGGFDEATPLLCVHAVPRSSRSFEALLPVMGTDRSVYAPDLPGFGVSDAVTGVPSVGTHAGTLEHFLQTLRLGSVDVLGVGFGAAVACELAIARPQAVRHLVLVHAPGAEAAGGSSSAPARGPVANDGGYLERLWQRHRVEQSRLDSDGSVMAGVAEELLAGTEVDRAMAALAEWPVEERLRLVKARILLLHASGELTHALKVALPVGATVEETPSLAAGLSGLATDTLAGRLRSFLKR